MPNASQRWSSVTNDSMDRRRSTLSGLARLIRYESCAIVARTRVSLSAARNVVHSSVSQRRSSQRFAIFVKICIADAPIARARGGASCVPPAIETCAPSRRSSSQTGGTHFGFVALSVFALKAGRFVDFFAGAFFAGRAESWRRLSSRPSSPRPASSVWRPPSLLLRPASSSRSAPALLSACPRFCDGLP